MGQTFTVSTAAGLSAALDNASAGDRIELEAGNYGELFLRSKVFGGEGVTIVSADPNNRAVFDKIHLVRSSDIHFDQIEVDFDPVGNTSYTSGFRATDGANISVTNSVLHGGPDPSLDPKYADAPVGVGVQIHRMENVNISGTEIFDFRIGINYARVDGMYVHDNYIHDMRTSPMTGGDVSNVEIIGNQFESSNPIDLGGTGDHGNMIHIFPMADPSGPQENIIIRDNFLKQGTNPSPILGIHLDDTGGSTGQGFRNVVIENNVLHNGDAQGIRAENVDGLSILNNSFVQSSGGEGQAPGIVLTRDTDNVTIDGNIIAGQLSGSSVDDPDINITLGDNLFTQDRDPLGENYAGDLFVNGLEPNADLTDLITRDGSAAAGFGADISQFGVSEEAYVAVLSDARGTGRDVKTITFEAQSLFTLASEADLAGSTVAWDFGDGTTGTGRSVAHTYATAGEYNVTATFTLADGTTTATDKTIEVFTAEAVTMDFEGGIADISDVANVVTVIGAADTEQSRFGTALRLSEESAYVEVERSEEILDNPEFSISMAFQKDGGTAANDDAGMLMYFSRTAFIGTKDGELTVGGVTSTGEGIGLEVETDAIDDGAWHHMTYTFSAETGTATLYLDGVKVDQQTGLTGIQATTNGHDMLVGGRGGGAFGGLIDEVQFTRAALSAQEVAAEYETLFEVDLDLPDGVAPPPDPAPDDAVEDSPQAPTSGEDSDQPDPVPDDGLPDEDEQMDAQSDDGGDVPTVSQEDLDALVIDAPSVTVDEPDDMPVETVQVIEDEVPFFFLPSGGRMEVVPSQQLEDRLKFLELFRSADDFGL
ncbi:MAG: LamG-like jellyroll fold domain-containing protein [Pseudomonadota bacterium]